MPLEGDAGAEIALGEMEAGEVPCPPTGLQIVQ